VDAEPGDPEQLVLGVQRDPQTALRRAAAVLTGDADRRSQVLAHWAIGMAHRELGEMTSARTELELAWNEAIAIEDGALAGQIAITLSLVLAFQGEITGALAILDLSEPGVADDHRGRLRTQRGTILYQHGDFAAALAEYEAALGLLATSGDELGELRQRINIGALLSYLGRLDDARDHLRVAAVRAEDLDQTLAQAIVEQNLAHIAALEGDFPSAFESFDQAAEHFRRCGYEGMLAVSLRLDHARALLRANLLGEAKEVADRALHDLAASEVTLDLAEGQLVAAEAHIAAGDDKGGAALAARSVEGFAALGRTTWAALARAVLQRALATSSPSEALAGEIAANADTLRQLGCRADAVRADLLAADLLVGLGDAAGADELLRRLEIRTSLVLQPEALRVRALVEASRGQRGRARRAVNLGVRLLAGQQAVLGALELRAHAAASSDGLAELGVAMAVADRRPRELLAHLEATRRTVSLLPAARPPDDDALADLLAQLRVINTQVHDAGADIARRVELDVTRLSLERQIRSHVRRAPATGARADVPLATSVARLGDRVLVEYANLRGDLYAVTVVDNRTLLHDLGPVDGLSGDIDACTHALHRLNRQHGSVASRAAAVELLDSLREDLARRLLPARVLRSARPVVIVPTGVLHALPWCALPGLAGRAVAVAPSLTGWAIAAEQAATIEHVSLIAGPGLDHAEREVEALAVVHKGPTVLARSDASADRALEAIGKSDLAHVACHGAYRADNPLFSTLRLDDGPLNAFDLERLPAIPRTVVLSACNVAMGAPAGGGALLGLASAVMTFGARSVIAPLTPVSDERVVAAMVQLHRGILDGLDAPTALGRVALDDEGRLDPTAAAFVVIGA
jgi:predicted negative regulator of RcsB-dependent stress response